MINPPKNSENMWECFGQLRNMGWGTCVYFIRSQGAEGPDIWTMPIIPINSFTVPQVSTELFKQDSYESHWDHTVVAHASSEHLGKSNRITLIHRGAHIISFSLDLYWAGFIIKSPGVMGSINFWTVRLVCGFLVSGVIYYILQWDFFERELADKIKDQSNKWGIASSDQLSIYLSLCRP